MLAVLRKRQGSLLLPRFLSSDRYLLLAPWHSGHFLRVYVASARNNRDQIGGGRHCFSAHSGLAECRGASVGQVIGKAERGFGVSPRCLVGGTSQFGRDKSLQDPIGVRLAWTHSIGGWVS